MKKFLSSNGVPVWIADSENGVIYSFKKWLYNNNRYYNLAQLERECEIPKRAIYKALSGYQDLSPENWKKLEERMRTTASSLVMVVENTCDRKYF